MQDWKEQNLDVNHNLEIILDGVVQGVGLRPALFQLADQLDLNGLIQNCGHQLRISIDGPIAELEQFLSCYPQSAPPFAQLNTQSLNWGQAKGYRQLLIEEGAGSSNQHLTIAPDRAICGQCLEEFCNPGNRRYLFPFITCTQCGPRYSITKCLPYERNNTSMDSFPLCSQCKAEYSDPSSSRFHAQSISCFDCGPKIKIHNRQGIELAIKSSEQQIEFLGQVLDQGQIIAFKGVGGYQLICDARNPQAIVKLRKRKHRPHRPLATMASSANVLHESPDFMQAISRPAGPIVVGQNSYDLPVAELSPDTKRLAFLLPTSGAHHYLFGIPGQRRRDFIVATSGNVSGDPMIFRDEQAIGLLGTVADYFVSSEREIIRPVDDSLVCPGPKLQVWRSARGFAPTSIQLAQAVPNLLALGADLKNTFCIGQSKQIYLCGHQGDLFQSSAYKQFAQHVERQLDLTDFRPKLIAVDSHPGYASTRFGKQFAKEHDLPLVEVQHHLAHAASVMAENNLERCLALCFDGTGYGLDHTFWGGECLKVDLTNASWNRVASLELIALLGHEQAIANPQRLLYAHLKAKNIPVQDKKLELLYQKRDLFPKTSSMGRLFDAVAALLVQDLTSISYEAQAAVALEALALRSPSQAAAYPVSWDGMRVQTSELVARLHADLKNGADPRQLASAFHASVADIGLAMVLKANKQNNLKSICLGGGVFQNQLLRQLLTKQLQAHGFQVFEPIQLPPGDGGLCLGQAVFAGQWSRKNA